MNPFNHPHHRILALPAALFTVAAGLFALSNRLRQEATADIISYRADELGRLFARVEVTAERGVLPGAPLLLRDARDRSYVYVPRAPFKQGEKFDVDVSNPGLQSIHPVDRFTASSMDIGSMKLEGSSPRS